MRNELRFALYAIKKNIQSSAELRVSFLTNILGMAINNTSFVVLWVFFVKSVGIINGWTAADIVGLQGFIALCYGIVFSLAGGVRRLPEYVANGTFDRFMLSPKNLLVRIATSSFNASGFGDVIFGVICLVFYAVFIHASAAQLLLIFFGIIISMVVFFSTAAAVYSVSFFFTDASATTNSLFELFMTPSLFHGGAFQGGMRVLFTFIIPSLVIGSLPVEMVRDVSWQKLLLISVLALLWFFLSLRLLSIGVKKYESSNLISFGN